MFAREVVSVLCCCVMLASCVAGLAGVRGRYALSVKTDQLLSATLHRRELLRVTDVRLGAEVEVESIQRSSTEVVTLIVGVDLSGSSCPQTRAFAIKSELVHTGSIVTCDVWTTATSKARRQGTSSIDRGNIFHDQSGIDARIDALAEGYPALASAFVVGDTIDGQGTIRGLRISTNPTVNDANKQEIVLVGNHHAREWISAEVPIAMAELLCFLYYTNTRVRALMQEVEFIIVPVVNPDGYIFSHSRDRFWRKNRRDNGDGTFGVDLNRNYPLYWEQTLGASTITSEMTFKGTAPGSEPETQALMALFRNRNLVSRLAFHVSYHNYGMEYLYPYGDRDENESPIHGFLHNMSLHLATNVVPGSPQGQRYAGYKASGLYPVSGDSVDWVHGEFDHVPCVTVELRPSVTGCCGFNLPEAQINATIMENFAAVLFMSEYAVASSAVASTASWWKDAATSAFDPSRVAPLDSDGNGLYDWFDRCPGVELLTPSNLFPQSSDPSKFAWPPTGGIDLAVVQGDACGVNHSISVFGGESATRFLRLTFLADGSQNNATESAISRLLRVSDCQVTQANRAELQAALAGRVNVVIAPIAGTVGGFLAVEVRNASWWNTNPRTHCMVDWRITGLTPADADRVTALAMSAAQDNAFSGSAQEIANLTDALLAPDPYYSAAIVTASPTTTTGASSPPAPGPSTGPTPPTPGQVGPTAPPSSLSGADAANPLVMMLVTLAVTLVLVVSP